MSVLLSHSTVTNTTYLGPTSVAQGRLSIGKGGKFITQKRIHVAQATPSVSTLSPPLVYCPPVASHVWLPYAPSRCHLSCQQNPESPSSPVEVKVFKVSYNPHDVMVCKCQKREVTYVCDDPAIGGNQYKITQIPRDIDDWECSVMCDQMKVWDLPPAKVVPSDTEPSYQCSWNSIQTATKEIVYLSKIQTSVVFHKGEPHISLPGGNLECPLKNKQGCHPYFGTSFRWKGNQQLDKCHLVMIENDTCIVGMAKDPSAPLEVVCNKDKRSYSVIGNAQSISCLEGNDKGLYLGASGLLFHFNISLPDTYNKIVEDAASMSSNPQSDAISYNYGLKSLAASVNKANVAICMKVCEMSNELVTRSRELGKSSLATYKDHVFKMVPVSGGWCLQSCGYKQHWHIIKQEGQYLHVNVTMDTYNATSLAIVDPSTLEILTQPNVCLHDGISFLSKDEMYYVIVHGTMTEIVSNEHFFDWSISGITMDNLVPILLDSSSTDHDVASWWDNASFINQPTDEQTHRSSGLSGVGSDIMSSIGGFLKEELNIVLWGFGLITLIVIGFMLCQLKPYVTSRRYRPVISATTFGS